MSDNSTKLNFPLLSAGLAQKHLTVNETPLRLDTLVQLTVISTTETDEPATQLMDLSTLPRKPIMPILPRIRATDAASVGASGFATMGSPPGETPTASALRQTQYPANAEL